MGHLNIVNYLIRKGANIDHQDNYGRSILSTCIYSQNRQDYLECMKLLIDNGANLNLYDSNNQTSLILAIKEQLQDAVILLLSMGCDIDFIDNDSYTAITYAIKNKDKKLVDILLKYKAATHILDKDGRSLLSIACSIKDSQDIVNLLMILG
jgi:ankyrin repeat protein